MQPSRILGAVLAGGLSTRFGSDKAVATLDGQRLLDLAVATLAPYCEAVVVIGRDDPGHAGQPDWPHPHMGPLGGFAGALRHASDAGYDAVLSCGVDSVALPAELLSLLMPAPAYLAAQPVVGLWPVTATATLVDILTGPGKHSVRRFAEAIGARAITVDEPPVNVNTPADLEAALRRHSP